MTNEQFLERTLCTYALESLATCKKHLELLVTDRRIPDESVTGHLTVKPTSLALIVEEAETLLALALARFDENVRQKEEEE